MKRRMMVKASMILTTSLEDGDISLIRYLGCRDLNSTLMPSIAGKIKLNG